MLTFLRKSFHRVVPAHFQNPVGLAWRLLKTRDPAAFWAMAGAATSLLLTPVDFLLSPFERRRYRHAEVDEQPVIFVCGPPRSGTTVTAQTLIQHLPVTYIDNFMATFPRSPLTARRLASAFIRPINQAARRGKSSVHPGDYHSYYGKSRGWSGANDGLFLWDRWIGTDRNVIPESLSPSAVEHLRKFFAACAAWGGAPVLNKCNNLNTFAHLVAEALPHAHFLCLTRDPLFLAQSLLKARWDIHGSERVAYGLTGHDQNKTETAQNAGHDDVYLDVCRQVRFHEAQARRQQELIGAQRFRCVSYEAFCENPTTVVNRVRSEILEQAIDPQFHLEPFAVANRVRISAEHIARLEQALAATESLFPTQRSCDGRSCLDQQATRLASEFASPVLSGSSPQS